jgi:hypothetical protein
VSFIADGECARHTQSAEINAKIEKCGSGGPLEADFEVLKDGNSWLLLTAVGNNWMDYKYMLKHRVAGQQDAKGNMAETFLGVVDFRPHEWDMVSVQARDTGPFPHPSLPLGARSLLNSDPFNSSTHSLPGLSTMRAITEENGRSMLRGGIIGGQSSSLIARCRTQSGGLKCRLLAAAAASW